MQLVDPTKPETWRNHPEPHLERALVEELEAIPNRRRPCGCPVLRFAWGQTRTEFRRGKRRLLYVDERIPAVETPRRSLRKVILEQMVKEYSHTDYETGEIVMKERREVSYDIIPLAAHENVPEVLPAGYFYHEDLPSLEWIGEQLWYVEQWMPRRYTNSRGEVRYPFGTLDEWESFRYEMWEDPETGEERWTDCIGPYPAEGRYVCVAVVGEPYAYPDFEERFDFVTKEFVQDVPTTREHLRYRPPGRDTIERMRRAWWEIENLRQETRAEAGLRKFKAWREHTLKQRDERRERNRKLLREVYEAESGARVSAIVQGLKPEATPQPQTLPAAGPNRAERRARKAHDRRLRKAA